MRNFEQVISIFVAQILFQAVCVFFETVKIKFGKNFVGLSVKSLTLELVLNVFLVSFFKRKKRITECKGLVVNG